jgi:hypothetical protein
MHIGIRADGWDSTIAAFRSMPASLKREVGRQSRDLAAPLAKELAASGRAEGSHAGGVAPNVKAGSRGGLPTVVASGKPYVTGSEFGGNAGTKTYYSRSKTGRRYLIVGRHTSRQFTPFVGQRGKWWGPTLDSSSGRGAVLEAWAKVVHDVISRW